MSSNSLTSHCDHGAPITAPGTSSPTNDSELLASDQLPSPLVSTSIQGIRQDIGATDRRIAGAPAMVNGLLATGEATLPCLGWLPPELLSEIFVLCIPPFPTRISTSHAPLLVEQICRRWRDIARATPRLWSSICLDLSQKALDSELDVTKTWLVRSAGCPLSIALGSDDLEKEREITHPALPILFANSNRWMQLRLWLPGPWLMCFDGVKGQLPLLQQLSLQCSFPTSDLLPGLGRGSTVDVFEHAQKLRTLELGRRIDTDGFTISWHNLTKLTAHGRAICEIMETLRRCPHLVECKFTGVYDVDPTTWDLRTFAELTLVHLQSLHLEIAIWRPEVFDTLILPAIRSIYLRFLPDDVDIHSIYDWVHRPAFVAMLSRAGCTLQSLSLICSRVRISDYDLIACLQATPSLVHLVMKVHVLDAFTNSFLEQLTPSTPGASPTETTCLVPRLEILKLEFAYSDFADEPFAEMAELRWRLGAAHSPLAKLHTIGVTLTTEGYYMQMRGTWTCLRALEEEGMTVILEGFEPPAALQVGLWLE